MTDVATEANDQTATPSSIILTDGAVAKVRALLSAEADAAEKNAKAAEEAGDADKAAQLRAEADLSLRVAVQPGGCSGLRYQLFFDERKLDGDVVTAYGEGDEAVNVVSDRMSAPYLKGATIDFVDTISKQGFTIENPNATGSCACGDSFH